MCCAYESTKAALRPHGGCNCSSVLFEGMHGKYALLCPQLEMAGVCACVCMSRTVVCAQSQGGSGNMGLVCLRTRGRDCCWPVRYFVVCAAQTLTRWPTGPQRGPRGSPERGAVSHGRGSGAARCCAAPVFPLLHHLVMWICLALSRDAHTCRRRGVECGVLQHGCLLDHCCLWLGFIVLSSTGPPDVWCEVCLLSSRVV